MNSQEGHKTYVIPAGGSSTLGAWGYIDGFEEMIQQVLFFSFLFFPRNMEGVQTRDGL